MIYAVRRRKGQMIRSLQSHWPEYLMEGAELALFMVAATAFTALIQYPASTLHHLVRDPFWRRFCIGCGMGLTAAFLIFSPFGKRSGAHMNPSVTLTFLRLGKVKPWDAVFYVIAQFAGGTAGIFLTAILIRGVIQDPAIDYILTAPGPRGPWVAFGAESVISFFLMLTILAASNTVRLSRWTGLFCAGLIALYVTVESPLSGMSMNPARSFGSAANASVWASFWIYCTAPLLGMLLAAELYVRGKGIAYCAKLHHHNHARCIFNCRFDELMQKDDRASTP
jgi:aquaporin Z